MKTKWTPGPWAYEQVYRQDGVPLPQWIVSSETALDDFGDELAVATYHFKEADARLGAASPDLYDALAEMLAAHSMETIGVDASLRRTDAKKAARAALAKARGEAE